MVKKLKHMIHANLEAGQAHLNREAAPGEFSKDEITDMENLVNKGENANTNSMEGEVECNPLEDIKKSIADLMSDTVDISVTDLEAEPECNPEDPECAEKMHHAFHMECEGPDCHHDHEHHHHHEFGESHMGKFVEKLLSESKLFAESDYAGPLDFVPDTRLNVADVVNALKAKIGDGSEGIHVDLDQDAEGNKIYKVSQIDKSKLPDTLDVVNVQLKLGDDGYAVEKTAKEFPVKKD